MTIIAELMLTKALRALKVSAQRVKLLEADHRAAGNSLCFLEAQRDGLCETVKALEKNNKKLRARLKQSRDGFFSAVVRNDKYLIELSYGEIENERLRARIDEIEKENVGLKADLRDSSARNGRYLLDLSREKEYSDLLRWRLNEIEPEKADVDYDDREVTDPWDKDFKCKKHNKKDCVHCL